MSELCHERKSNFPDGGRENIYINSAGRDAKSCVKLPKSGTV
jgi:hypothetical protein